MIEIKSMRYSIDWAYQETNKIDETTIFGFELHWRLDTWHVVVKTKKKCEGDKFYSYDLSHWVDFWEIVKLLRNPAAKILRIVNYWSSDNFTAELKKLFVAVLKKEKECELIASYMKLREK